MQNKILFSQLDNDTQVARCTIPQRVFSTKNPDDETYAQKVERQNKFIALPVFIKEKLSSSDTGEKIQKIGAAYHLKLFQMAGIARAVRSYYFGELRLDDFPQALVNEASVSPAIAREISSQVIQKIINDKSQEEEYRSKIERLTLADALKKFPDLGEQLVTQNKISLKSFPEPVRPSVKNWLFDYTFNTGHDGHDSMTRGNYLFQSPNAKPLTAADRQKLEYLLKAYDENTLVEVNVNTKQMMFPTAASNPQRVMGEAPQVATNNPKTMNAFSAQIQNSKFKIQNSNQEPEDIFQKTKENEAQYFSGPVVKNGQWLNLKAKNKVGQTPKPIGSVATNFPVKNYAPEKTATVKNNFYPEIAAPAKTLTITAGNSTSVKTPTSPVTQPQPAAKLEFSSPHKLPFEKQADEPSATRPVVASQPFVRSDSVAPKPTVKTTLPTQSIPVSSFRTGVQLTSTPKMRPSAPIPSAATPQPVTPSPAPRPVAAPQPIRIVPSGFQENSTPQIVNTPPSKNVVNLKE